MRRTSNRQEQLVKLSKREPDEAALIRKMRQTVKKDPVVVKAFKEYGVQINKLDGVSIEFDDLDVSAKTKDCKIYLNRKLMENVDETDLASYLVHELTHWLAQSTGNIGNNEAKDYLDKPDEEDAFSAQVKFKKEHKGQGPAEEYVDSLLDYHDLVGKKREDKKKRLMGGGK